MFRFFFNDAATTEIYTLSLHDALPIYLREMPIQVGPEKTVGAAPDTVRMVAPRGARTIERILDENASWEVPAWVYADRGLQPGAERDRKSTRLNSRSRQYLVCRLLLEKNNNT